MSLFANLNENVLISVLSEWLLLKNLAACSTSYCNKNERNFFEDLIGNNVNFATQEVVSWVSNEDQKQWNWLLDKRIRLKTVKIANIETNQLLIIFSNLHKDHLISLTFTNVNPNKQTGKFLINFINNCDKLKELCFVDCDLLEKSEFVSKINLQELTHLAIEKCNTYSVNNNSAVWISNTAEKLAHLHLFNMKLEIINTIMSHNYKSIIDCSFVTHAVDLASHTLIDKLFESLNKLIIGTRFSLSYEGYLPTLLLSNILPFLKKNKNILLFNIFPIKNDGWKVSSGAEFNFFNSLDGIHDVGMMNVKCSTIDLLDFFSMITVYRWIFLKFITGINSQVIDCIGTHSNTKYLVMTGCGTNLDDVTVLQKYFQPADAQTNWNTIDLNVLRLKSL
jgi:hypothetical protein